MRDQTNTTAAPSSTRKTLTLRGVRPGAVRTPPVPEGTSSDLTERFWFLWAPSRRRPEKRQPSLAAALAEADRLTELNPGVRFDVFEARRVARRLK